MAACVQPPAPPEPAPAATIRFLLTNDVYVADTLADGTGGLARVAWVERMLEREGPLTSVLAGDVLSPSLLSKWFHGRQMVEAFNTTGLDYATFGNHEFELDRDTLIARIAESRFRWLSANCTQANGTPFPLVASWDTLTRSGVRIGVFGLTLRGGYRSYVRCSDPDSAAHVAIEALRAAGAALVIGLTHQTYRADSALLAREPALDLILGGHEHEAHRIDVGGRLVIKADANARSAQFVELARGSSGWHQRATLHAMDATVPLDSTTARVAAAWRDSLLHRLGPERVVATAPQAVEGRDAVLRRREAGLGDLVADALRAGTGADIALLGSGTLRLDDVLGPGPISNYTLESIFLFADETRVVTFPISGARLHELLEHGVSDRNLGRGGFLQVSGIAFRYDRARRSGSRVIELHRDDGRPITAGDTLRVAFNSYPACTGGDDYRVPEAAAACASLARAPRAVDLLIAHVRDRLGGQLLVPPAGRITEAVRARP